MSRDSMIDDVIERASCANCRRPITYLRGVGWLHDELPQYAAGPFTCGVAAPVELRCAVCLLPQERDNAGRVSSHTVDGQPCEGAWSQGLPLIEGEVDQ